ncbi:hypothetical protein GWK47_048322 [Chionoecetes opilio]|uniref:Uncharacterized protein n=1 Tax=Chionoecetes opilio TaxID=41210 RepID=A0A8J4YC36_CHIOP|nr:hypothetical protein GWK47_048322 [Chionoecetes opilio]
MFYGLSTRAFRRMVLKYAEAVGSPAISDVWRRVGDFVLVQLSSRGRGLRSLSTLWPRFISLEEDGRLQLDFLRIKSPLLKDTFHFPAIGDVDSVDRSRVLGSSQSARDHPTTSKPDQGPPSLEGLNMH